MFVTLNSCFIITLVCCSSDVRYFRICFTIEFLLVFHSFLLDWRQYRWFILKPFCSLSCFIAIVYQKTSVFYKCSSPFSEAWNIRYDLHTFLGEIAWSFEAKTINSELNYLYVKKKNFQIVGHFNPISTSSSSNNFTSCSQLTSISNKSKK